MAKEIKNISQYPFNKDKISKTVSTGLKFKLKKPPAKEETVYKTLYIKQSVVIQLEKIAVENNTSFNNVVISMIESYLEEE